jgi:hypothetical protein
LNRLFSPPSDEQVEQGQKVKRIKTGPLPEIFLSLTVMLDAEKTEKESIL